MSGAFLSNPAERSSSRSKRSNRSSRFNPTIVLLWTSEKRFERLERLERFELASFIGLTTDTRIQYKLRDMRGNELYGGA
jgi:hypothetical protein